MALRRRVGVLPLVPAATEQAPTVEQDKTSGALGRARLLVVLVRAALRSWILCIVTPNSGANSGEVDTY